MNEPMIRRWYDVFKDNHKLTEIRILDSGRKTFSGYFTDIETLITAIKPYDNYNIYFTLNTINDGCYDREQRDKIIQKPKSTTNDNDIVAIDWLMVDIDVEKPSDTNSTDEEKEMAKKVANNVYAYLRDMGFSEPVVCDSSNGVHLDYKVAMLNNDENTNIRRDFLQVLDMMFSTENVKVDCATFNASRICKCYGVMSRKGSKTSSNRPQRESAILRVPSETKVTPTDYIKKVATFLPKKDVPNKSNNYSNEKFDIDAFIEKHGIQVRNKSRFKGGVKYVLEECCFNSQHKAPDSAIFVTNDGAIGFKCLHASCSNYNWKDFRMKFDPNAYDKKDYNEFKQKQTMFGTFNREPFVRQLEDGEKGKKWLSLKDVKWVDLSSIVAIPTGYTELDKKAMGLLMGDITVVSGSSGSGKSSWLNCISLNAIQRGFKVALWSGELQDFRIKGWINQVAAGKNYVIKKDGYDNLYYVSKQITEKIDNWTDGKLFLYNNRYGSKWNQLFEDIKDVVDKTGVQLVIVDNLMALQLDGYDGDKYSKQTKFINDIKEYAKLKNIHIVLVAHPRKENLSQLLRKESISGTADLINMADNCFICHRVGNDFKSRATEFFGSAYVDKYLCFSSVVEIAKNRSMGIVDVLVGMYFEVETRRLKNAIAEHVVYGWQDEPIQQEISQMDVDDQFNNIISNNNSFFSQNDGECPF